LFIKDAQSVLHHFPHMPEHDIYMTGAHSNINTGIYIKMKLSFYSSFRRS